MLPYVTAVQESIDVGVAAVFHAGCVIIFLASYCSCTDYNIYIIIKIAVFMDCIDCGEWHRHHVC